MTEALRITNLYTRSLTLAEDGVPVHGADAIGASINTNGQLGADLIHVPAGNKFPVHVHPGDHLLICLAGTGTITVDNTTYEVEPGDCYMVDGSVPHAVGAGSADHVLLAIGSPHKAIDSPERMSFTDWDGHAVATPTFVGDDV